MIGKQMKSRNPLLIGLLTLMAWLWAMPSLSQGVAFGVKGGIDVMKMEFDDDVFDDSNRGGWFVGPTVVFSVPVPGFSIDLSALYDERTLKVEGEKLEQKSVIIPANARIGASLGFGSVYLCGGPQLAFNVGASSYRWEDVKNEVKQYELEGFEFVNCRKVIYDMELTNSEDIHSLFSMTPYYYKTGKTEQDRLDSLSELTTTAAFPKH